MAPQAASMLRAETVGKRKVIRGGRPSTTPAARQSRHQVTSSARRGKKTAACPSSSPLASSSMDDGDDAKTAAAAAVAAAAAADASEDNAAAGDAHHHRALSFLDLPPEIRIMIYNHLLLSPDPVVISPRRRQLRLRVSTLPAATGNTYLRARPPAPRKVMEWCRHDGDDGVLHTALLRTCRQVNAEGTHILYGKNSFVVGQLMPFHASRSAGGGTSAVEAGYYPTYFFPWHLRQSTLAQIPSVTFHKACYCTTWLLVDNRAHETDGRALRRRLFPPPLGCFPGGGGGPSSGNGGGSPSSGKRGRSTSPGFPGAGSLLPSPRAAKDTFRFINTSILEASKGVAMLSTCPHCFQKYGWF